MEDIQEQQGEGRQREIEELRSHLTGKLLYIIKELEAMNLSVKEIETVLRTCGLNDDCAMNFGASMTAEKEKSITSWGRPEHP